jgi:hypothetical protein
VIRLLGKLSLAAPTAAALLLASSAFAQDASSIHPAQGGRTTLTLSKDFQAEVVAAGATVSTFSGAELDANQIAFGVSTGEINLANAEGQIVHNGGIALTTTTKQVTLDGLMLTTFGEQAYVSALVTANGHFVGRVNVFDVTLSSDLKLPIVPKDGHFYLGLSWSLDPAGAAALNDALNTTAFHDSVNVGYSSSLVFVPLSADPPPTTTTPPSTSK